MNEQNLIPNNRRSKEEVREHSRKGGIKSGEVRRMKKTVAQALRDVINEPLSEGSEQSRLDALTYKAIRKMFDNPDIRDLKILAEILGEVKQTIQQEGMVLNIQTTEEGAKNLQKMMTDIENED